MPETKRSPQSEIQDFGATESRLRVLILNAALIIGTLTTTYFGMSDILVHRMKPAVASLFAVVIFCLMLVLINFLPRVRKIVLVAFVFLVGISFLALLATQFPAPTIVFWCFPFPLVALFLLGRKPGGVALIIYNLGIISIFLLDHYLQVDKYTYEYGIRYCGVMIVISVLSYYYEASRTRSQAALHAANQLLEMRVEERTKALLENQERLRQAEKLESIGLLAGGVAHDFNNQLTGIMAFADLIRVTAEDGTDIRGYAENILAGSRRSADLTGKLLAFARKGNFQAIPVDMHHVVTDVISLLKHTVDKRITLRTQLRADPPTIRGDPSQLHNALLNLALNARDAMPSGGELEFATDIVDFEETYCKTLPYEIRPGTFLHLCITDTGCGMDKNTLQHLFEPFFTTKERGKGTGMGLAAVYGTVRSHEGAITVDSKPGRGTVINLYFPHLKTAAPTPGPEAETAPEETGHGHILLVDDEQTVYESVEKMLRLLGYTVTVCNNGREAVDYYKDNWKSVDLVILDMVMPVMGGRETFVSMKLINPDIIALLASGYSLDGEARDILGNGVKGFIQKPFALADLRKEIFTLVRKRA